MLFLNIIKAKNDDINQKITNLIIDGLITPTEAFIILEKNETREVNSTKQETEKPEDIMKELNELIGLHSVKKLVLEIQAFVKIQQIRRKQGLLAEPLVLHMIFKGNPGTGKTTVARLLGKMFKQINILQKGHTVEVERADLVGEYIGHTAQKTRQQISKAIGGILFIDEAYSLARGGSRDFGKEAIDTLVKAMEDQKNNFIVILAGYKDEMEWFLDTNPGLRSRFPIIINFDDYSIEELMQIAKKMAKNREYRLTSRASQKLKEILLRNQKEPNFGKMGNARLVRNILEKAIRQQALRLANKKGNITKEDLVYIRIEDLAEV